MLKVIQNTFEVISGSESLPVTAFQAVFISAFPLHLHFFFFFLSP